MMRRRARGSGAVLLHRAHTAQSFETVPMVTAGKVDGVARPSDTLIGVTVTHTSESLLLC
eukprot:SAG31_NODE_85_length_26982_cov_19.325485_13_plen_60_part_00